VTDTSTSADFSSVADSADSSAEAAPSQADSFDEGDGDYDSLPDYGETAGLDEGDADYDSLPDYGADDGLKDPELSYDELPGPDQPDPSSEPQPWAPDETVQLHPDESSGDLSGSSSSPSDHPGSPSDQPPTLHDGSSAPPAQGDSQEVDAARGELAQAYEQAEREQEARDALDAAYAQAEADGVPPNSIEQFDADAQQAIDEAPSDTGAKQLEFKEPGPPKEVEFKEPSQAKEVEFKEPTAAASYDAGSAEHGDASQQAELPREVHSPDEQRVVNDAKADLESREQAGELLGGDPMGRADQWHQQGQNDLGYQQDCALASTSAVLRDCGVDASESDVVDQAASAGLCETGNANPADNGGVQDGEAISELLSKNGVENRIENPQDVQELAAFVEQGHGVITEIDAEELWGTPTEYSPAYYDADGRSNVNHAVQVTGTVRDSSGELTGIVVNDTGSPGGAGTVVPTERWDACWSNTNNDHETVVTSRPTSVERAGR
jgi:hypothetical protein